MKTDKNMPNFFEISRESANISFEDFCSGYYDTEQPVVIESVAKDWPAKTRWNEKYIRKSLAKEATASTASLWYWMERNTLNSDYTTPELIDTLLDSPDVFPRNQIMRIWLHQKGNVSSWHYDANMVNVFNVQATGRKEWLIVSPETPLDFYPFTNFAIMDGKDERNLSDRIHSRFMLNQGDMLYLPPLWTHKVISCDEENISLNWIFTKKETSVSSKALKRELERYFLQEYLSEHRWRFVRNTFNKVNAKIPGYLRWKWRYPEMIKTPETKRRFPLIRRTFNEFAVIGKVLLHASKIGPYIEGLKSVKKLDKKLSKE
jgi:oxalate decarboxylase/phosphoglucose isomerase-like protein (cupin superfamily)